MEDDRIEKTLPKKRQIEYFIIEDDIEKALNFLTAYIDDGHPCIQELIMIKANFSRYMYLSMRMLDSRENLEITRRQIKQSILDLTNRCIE